MTMIRREPTPIPESDVEITAVRSQGAGGQNVNKVSSAIHLRFDIPRSSLSEDHKHRLLVLRDQRISREGVLVIKAQSHRSQEQNRVEAFARLQALVDSVAQAPTVRKATKPTAGSRQRRLEGKKRRGEIKQLRVRIEP
jgi:ribosome-associated protein